MEIKIKHHKADSKTGGGILGKQFHRVPTGLKLPNHTMGQEVPNLVPIGYGTSQV